MDDLEGIRGDLRDLLHQPRRREVAIADRFDPSRLSTAALVDLEGILRVGQGLPYHTPTQRARHAAVREQGLAYSYRAESNDPPAEAFDPDRLTDEQRERLVRHLEKARPPGADSVF